MKQHKNLKTLRRIVSGADNTAYKVADELATMEYGFYVLEELARANLVGDRLWELYRIKYNGDYIQLYCDIKAKLNIGKNGKRYYS